MTTRLTNHHFLAGFIALSLVACNQTDPIPTQPYSNGVIVVNAGNFSDNNGTLSLIQREGQTVLYDIFQKENMRSLAGGISGYSEAGDKGIILIDNSTAGKDAVEIVNAGSFKAVATITDIENPRNVVKVSDSKAYITCWDATGDFSNFYKNPGYVAVIDLTTNKLTKKIPVQNGAETIVIDGTDAYVGNTGSGKTTITAIDLGTDTKKSDINIGRDPHLIGIDANSKLWIYAGGELLRFNLTSKTVETRLKISSSNASKSPSSFVMSADKKTVYFTHSFYDAADCFKQNVKLIAFR